MKHKGLRFMISRKGAIKWIFKWTQLRDWLQLN
jgi:hypothetical protein